MYYRPCFFVCSESALIAVTRIFVNSVYIITLPSHVLIRHILLFNYVFAIFLCVHNSYILL